MQRQQLMSLASSNGRGELTFDSGGGLQEDPVTHWRMTDLGTGGNPMQEVTCPRRTHFHGWVSCATPHNGRYLGLDVHLPQVQSSDSQCDFYFCDPESLRVKSGPVNLPTIWSAVQSYTHILKRLFIEHWDSMGRIQSHDPRPDT